MYNLSASYIECLILRHLTVAIHYFLYAAKPFWTK
jgi:hypothetical protein